MIESLLFCWHPNGVDGFARLMIWRRLVIRDHSVINRFPKRPFQFCMWSICNLDALLFLCFGAECPNLILYLLKLQNVFVEIANIILVAHRISGQWSGQKSRCSASICSATSPTNKRFRIKRVKEKLKIDEESHSH